MTVDPRALDAGSIPYGERQTFEQNLPDALGAGSPVAQEAPAEGGALAIPEDPLGALLSGEIAGDPNQPSTAGLSVGPGAGPTNAPDVMMGSRAERLRMLATESTSPLIQAAARNELRRMAREGL